MGSPEPPFTIRAGREAAALVESGRVFPEGTVLTETRGEVSELGVQLRSGGQSRD